jgi:hypothetical protein
MNEAMLHRLAGELGGRFKLTMRVQKRLVDLMNERSEIITKNCGGRPVRLVVEQVAKDVFHLGEPAAPQLAEKAGQPAA